MAWDMKTMFHCSIVMFFIGGLTTLSFYRNYNQEAVSRDVDHVTLTTAAAAVSTTKSINQTGMNTSRDKAGRQVFEHQKLLKITPSSLMESCDFFSGRWVHDNKSHYPLYKEDECPFLHGDLACQTYGRKDSKYQQWRWQPHGCDFPKFDGKRIVEKLVGKRLLFVGDSVNRNQWDSMMCMLYSSIPGKKKLGMGLNRTLYTFRSNDYNISVDYYWAPMLVESNGDDPSNHSLDHRTIRIKSIEKHAKHWVDADILVFNTYLWWRLPIIKLLKGPGSVLGGPNQVYDEINNLRAYKMVLETWSEWVHTNIDPAKTKMFFMGLTATHSNAKDWGGKKQETCYKEKEPVMVDGFWESGTDPKMLRILESSLSKLKAKGMNVQLINITQLTQYRKDAHPTVHRRLWRPLTNEQKQNPQRASDCTHWCLPGVPDVWNELLLAYIFPVTENASQ
ncbi:hypothetical protein R6Q57_017278 [Mikania cordata]